jgi:hypothetical protein
MAKGDGSRAVAVTSRTTFQAERPLGQPKVVSCPRRLAASRSATLLRASVDHTV